jgi:hypothetical protein
MKRRRKEFPSGACVTKGTQAVVFVHQFDGHVIIS